MSDHFDVHGFLVALPAEFDDPGANPWGTANVPCSGEDKCDTCRWLDEVDDAPALREAFAQPRRFEVCSGSCCREASGFLTDDASAMVLEEFDQDFPRHGGAEGA